MLGIFPMKQFLFFLFSIQIIKGDDEDNNGLYLPYKLSMKPRYCKGTQLPIPNFRDSSIDIRLPNITLECMKNATKSGPSDDMATTLWKIFACQIQSKIDKPQIEIGFKEFFSYYTKDYKNEIKLMIRNATVDCCDAETQTEFHLRVKGYLFCLYKAEKKVCNEPKPNATLKEKFRENYSFYQGKNIVQCGEEIQQWTQGPYCCRGSPTPIEWIDYDFSKFNDDILNSNEVKYCVEFLDNNRDAFSGSPEHASACILNPLPINNDGTSNWNITLNLTEGFDHGVFRDFKISKAVKMELLRNIAILESQVDFEVTNSNQTRTLKDFETGFSNSKTLRDRLYNYCNFYYPVEKILTKIVQMYCQPDAVPWLDVDKSPISRYVTMKRKPVVHTASKSSLNVSRSIVMFTFMVNHIWFNLQSR